MALAAVVTDVWDDGQRLHVIGTIAVSGNYVNPGGDPLSFAGVDKIYSDKVPVRVDITPRASGFTMNYIPGATRDAGKVKTFGIGSGAAGLTEVANGAYNAALTGDTVDFHAIFKKL